MLFFGRRCSTPFRRYYMSPYPGRAHFGWMDGWMDGSYSIEIYVDQAVIGLLVKTTFSLFWSKLSSLNQGYSANMTSVSLNFRIVKNNTSSKCRVFRLIFLWKRFPRIYICDNGGKLRFRPIGLFTTATDPDIFRIDKLSLYIRAL